MTISPQYGAPKRRPNMRKAVFLFPSGLTLLNLFFGIFAIIAASRLEFTIAGVYVVIGGICDALDGRVARATNAGTQFGEELDSLVDAITFGLAPGMIMYFAVLNRGGWDWIWVFAFSAAAVLRLARFNIEQAGTAKTYFQGLPSPAAGITLASYYWFSQSALYNVTQAWFTQTGMMARLPWHYALRLLIAVLAALMISNVPYPTFPRTGFRSLRALGATFIVFGAFALLVTGRLEYFFPIALIYVAFGLVRWLLAGLFERRQPTVPYDLSEGEDDDDDAFEVPVPAAAAPRGGRRDERAVASTKQRGRGDRPERTDRPARPEREPRGPRSESASRSDKVESSDRPSRAEKGDRPQRTEAERAARREKREKRDSRQERGARPDQAAATAPATGVTAIVVGDAPSSEPVPPDEVIGRLAGAAEPEATSTEGAPTRKRKRRRRRGDRKDRSGAPLSDTSSAGDEGPDDSGSDDGGADDDSRSPYSTPPSAFAQSAPPTVAAPAVAAPITPPAPQPPAAPPTPPSSSSSDSSE